MDQYPDEDEEFELRYQEEMEMIGDLNPDEEVNYVSGFDIPSGTGAVAEALDLQPSTSKGIRSLHTFESPQLSQISFGTDDGVDAAVSHVPVNRRLFGTPIGAQRGSSTPFTTKKRLSAIQEVIDTPVAAELAPVNAATEALQNVGLRSKRRLERDLFSDIDDINGETSYVDPIAKKARSEEQRDLEMIAKILETRRRVQDSSSIPKQDNLSRLNELHAFKMRNLSYRIPQWPFLPLARSDGETVYVRYHSEEYEARALENVNVCSRGYSELLGETREQAWAGANEIILQRTNVAKTQPLTSEQAAARVSRQISEDLLWVEKYKPKSYVDLLSDETTNRTLLFWLKMWEKVVFGREFKGAKMTAAGELNSFNKKTGRFESNGGWQHRKRRQDLIANVDDLGRPMQRVALLCGPPGLGKTTLAHTIARHAGYAVREINASDDRSPDAFKLALENGTQMKSVLNSEKRPNCIILDEIDGAPKQSIDFLVKFVSDEVSSKPKAKGAKSQKSILKRPIICICNDIYEPALRQLRQIAFVVSFPPIESARLAERLLQIARREKLRTDFGSLITLAEKSGNDVRSCISTMQFFNAQKKALTLADVLSSKLGQKDRHQGLFEVWGAIFRIQRPTKQLERSTPEQEAEVTMTDMSVERRVSNVLNAVHSGGDYERLTQGVFENYLQQKMPDPNLNGVVEASQWFCFSDSLHHQISQMQNYAVYPYLQYGFVVWHLLFASLAWPKITFPTRGFEFHQKRITQSNIFQAFRKGMSSGAIGVGQGYAVLMETVPLLKRILSPQLRSVAIQLLSPKESNDLQHTVEVMVDLGLTYTQVSKPDGHYVFQMEPDIETLSQFPGFPALSLAYFGRQLIAREVQLEQMRRAMPRRGAHLQSPASSFKAPGRKELPNHLQTLQPKQLAKSATSRETKEAVSKDFFGRIQRKTATTLAEEATPDPIVKSPIWYRFKEGFNNAVRKDIHMTELL